MPRISISANHTFLICATIFGFITFFGAVSDGNTSDDWWMILQTPDSFVLYDGRWFQHFLGHYVFGDRFVVSLKFLLAFGCLFGASRLMAQYMAPKEWREITATLTFIVGTNHPYMQDLFAFAVSAFEYPFAMAASVLAFHLATRGGGAARLFTLAAASQLLALSLGTYQAVAVTGLLVPLCAFAPMATLREALFSRITLNCVLITLAGFVLYFIEFELYQELTGIHATSIRHLPLSWEILQEKLRFIHYVAFRILSLTLYDVPDQLKWFNRLIILSIFGLSAFCGILMVVRGKVGSLAQRVSWSVKLWLLTGAMILVVPMLIYPVAPYLAPRVFAYAGFFYVAAFFINAQAIDKIRGQTTMGQFGFGIATGGSAAFLTMVAVVYVFVSASISEDRARLANRDVELTRAIFSRVIALEGYDGQPFHIFGGVKPDPRLVWGGGVGRTTFFSAAKKKQMTYRFGNFRELYRLPWKPQIEVQSPIPCPAWPAHASVFMHEGTAYVCLEAWPQ